MAVGQTHGVGGGLRSDPFPKNFACQIVFTNSTFGREGHQDAAGRGGAGEADLGFGIPGLGGHVNAPLRLASGVGDDDLGLLAALGNQGQVAGEALGGVDDLLLAAILKDRAAGSGDFHDAAGIILAAVEHEQHIARFQHTPIPGATGIAPDDLVGFRNDRGLRPGNEVRMADFFWGSLLSGGVGDAGSHQKTSQDGGHFRAHWVVRSQ